MLRTIGAIASVSILIIGCGGPGSFDGNVAGYELDVEDSVFIGVRNSQGGIRGAMLLMSDYPDVCSDFGNSRWRQDSTLLIVNLVRILGSETSTGIEPDEGTYVITPTAPSNPGRYAIGSLIKLDASCNNVLDDDYGETTGGTIDIEKIEFGDDGVMRGSFELTFGQQGDEATGSFNADSCDNWVPPDDAICAG